MCNVKNGEPSTSFWNQFNIEFDHHEYFAPIGYNPRYKEYLDGWKTKYSPIKYPVLAFTGSPADFPVAMENVPLQKYLKWSDYYENKANEFIDNLIGGNKFIGLHLRNGHDFVYFSIFLYLNIIITI